MLSVGSFQLLWSLKTVPSALMCIWRIIWDRLPTRANLVRRGVQLGCALCPLCREDVESVQHLFCTCKVTQKVWDSCEKWMGRVTVRHKSIPIHFQSFHLRDQRKSVNRAWKGMLIVVVIEERW